MEQENLLPIRILHDFVERIERLEIAYMLTGSMAMMRYSVYRFTADVDIVLELKTQDSRKIINSLEPDYYVPHNSVRRAITDERMFNVIHQETAFKIDCVVRKSSEYQKKAFSRREKTDFYGRGIWIINKDDLIIAKLWWAKDSHSEKQLTDIKNLLRSGFDAEYIDFWVENLKVSELFDECLTELKK